MRNVRIFPKAQFLNCAGKLFRCPALEFVFLAGIQFAIRKVEELVFIKG